jgi:hypothetical protein
MSIIRADSIKSRDGNGAPDFPNGLTVTGVVTATSMSQNISGNLSVTGNLGVGGVVTYEDVTNVDSIGVGTFRDGLRVTGICTATAFHGDGSSLTGIDASSLSSGGSVIVQASASAVTVTAGKHLNPATTNTTDLGTSSLRWRNLYTQDLQLSNESSGGNNVDGTWGNWTLQEGENDIFMINNRNGKKYKINLTEV